jgi:hypothetical protein
MKKTVLILWILAVEFLIIAISYNVGRRSAINDLLHDIPQIVDEIMSKRQ